MLLRSGSQALAGVQVVVLTQEASGFPWGTGTQTIFIFEISNPDKAERYEPASDTRSGVGLHIKGKAHTWGASLGGRLVS